MVKMTNQPDWYQAAQNYLAQERQDLARNVPPATAITVTWKGQAYIGGIQQAAPEYSDEIVLLSKTSHPIREELIRAIVELDKSRLSLTVERTLNLEGRLHLLRRVGDQLQQMTADQLEYMERLRKAVIDPATGDITTETKSHRYMRLEDMGPRRN